MKNLADLFRAWIDTDEAWSAAIAEAFPKRHPGDVRYTPRAHGLPGTKLRAAYDARQQADAAFSDAGGTAWLQGGTARLNKPDDLGRSRTACPDDFTIQN